MMTDMMTVLSGISYSRLTVSSFDQPPIRSSDVINAANEINICTKSSR